VHLERARDIARIIGARVDLEKIEERLEKLAKG
jgi:hypothetical protein